MLWGLIGDIRESISCAHRSSLSNSACISYTYSLCTLCICSIYIEGGLVFVQSASIYVFSVSISSIGRNVYPGSCFGSRFAGYA